MRQWFVLAVVCAAVFAIVNANAAEEKKGDGAAKGGGAFVKMDADGDGAISLDEFQKARNATDAESMKKAERIFKQIDTDGNGSVCAAEFKKWQENKAARKSGE